MPLGGYAQHVLDRTIYPLTSFGQMRIARTSTSDHERPRRGEFELVELGTTYLKDTLTLLDSRIDGVIYRIYHSSFTLHM